MLGKLPAVQISSSKCGDFVRNQYRFSPIEFRSENYERTISDYEVIPMEGSLETDMVGKGAQGKIFGFEIPSRYHNFFSLNGFALKRFHDQEKAEPEIKALKALYGQPVASLAQIYSGFTFKEKTYLIAERAEKSLRDLMRTSSPFQCDKSWLRSQMRELAKAMKGIHETLPEHIIVNHDIKPDNILLFTRRGIKQVMRITDWGCASVYKPDLSCVPQSHKRGDPPYHPPESRDGAPTSCPHDIWSLGCVFLELLIWHHEGADALDEFREAHNNDPNTHWFTHDSDKKTSVEDPVEQTTLLPFVQEKLDDLTNSAWTGECKILSRMLESDPMQRITAGDLLKALDQLIKTSGN